MHKEGVLHLDLKPQNILLDENLVAKIADFGSCSLFHAETLEEENQPKTENKKEFDRDVISEARGTMYFLAPEAVQDQNSGGMLGSSSRFSGRKYDVWTLGVTLYILTFNELPYKLNSKGQGDIQSAIASFQVDFEEQSGRRAISEGLQMFLYKMMEKDPKKRATTQQLMKDVWLNQGS
uniref:Protein kinase domain-containing protein n=1 Tax=Strombidium rassoulzadegani TaxID=1082188 RepID=A0A7S3CV01_9SPIT|mmetsp:Transcript_7392/g.12477  ORF Transcript_7392/g.12477 Transcript_7392/m.12477 type:complete len:179 (+) Transcript_7392:504-1040(+)